MLRHFMGLGGLVLAGFLTLGGAACNSDDKPADQAPPDPYPNFDAFCDALAGAQCTLAIQEDCELNDAGAADACIREVSNGCKSKSIDLTADIKTRSTSTCVGTDPNCGYHKDKVPACLAAVNAVYSTAQIASADHITIKAACNPVFQGNHPAGFGCVDDSECAPDLGCYRADLGAEKGTCEKIITRSKGDDCSGKGDVCAAGSFCTANDKICGGRPDAVGKPCAANRPCIETMLCTGIDATTGAGTCADKLPSSSSSVCVSDEECVSGYCAQLGSKKQCVNKVGFTTGAASCENFDGL